MGNGLWAIGETSVTRREGGTMVQRFNVRRVAIALGALALAFALLVLPMLLDDRADGVRRKCAGKMHLLATGALMYAQDWDETLPPGNQWLTDISEGKYVSGAARDRVGSPAGAWCTCPAVSAHGYAINAGIASHPLDQISGQAVLLFETDSLGPDIAGSASSMARTRHRQLNLVYTTGEAVIATDYAKRNSCWDLPCK